MKEGIPVPPLQKHKMVHCSLFITSASYNINRELSSCSKPQSSAYQAYKSSYFSAHQPVTSPRSLLLYYQLICPIGLRLVSHMARPNNITVTKLNAAKHAAPIKHTTSNTSAASPTTNTSTTPATSSVTTPTLPTTSK